MPDPVIPFATITLTLFNVTEDQLGILVDPQGDLPKDPTARAEIFREAANSLLRFAQPKRPARRLPK